MTSSSWSSLLWRLALAAAHRDAPGIPSAEQAAWAEVAQAEPLRSLSPEFAWALLAEGLMAPQPGHFVQALREGGVLRLWLPEVDALFGVPELCDLPTPVDVGEHLLALLSETARSDAPLNVRLAALLVPLGKPGSPREIWPSHYKHEQRAHAIADDLSTRLAWPSATLDLARLAIDEMERVHRASDLRAGAITALLERLDALGRPERFEDLLLLCTCDFAAYPGHRPQDYPKAERLRRALAACRATPVAGLDAEATQLRRAQAVHQALRGGLTATLPPQS